MNNRDLDFLNLRDLKSVAKYYGIEHKSRIKRVELEALIYMAEHVQALGVMNNFDIVQVGEESGMQIMDIVPDTSSNSPYENLTLALGS
jgi:hypothetical protein